MKETILVVDDEPDILSLTDLVLEHAGFDTVNAKNGPEALEKLKSVSPDLILLDVVMPGMDGFELCRILRTMPEQAKVPIVIYSVLYTESNKKRSQECGANTFISKPMEPDDIPHLVSVCRRLISDYRSNTE